MALVETNKGRSSVLIACVLAGTSIVSHPTASHASSGMESDATADTKNLLLLAGFNQTFKQLSFSVTDAASAANFKETA